MRKGLFYCLAAIFTIAMMIPVATILVDWACEFLNTDPVFGGVTWAKFFGGLAWVAVVGFISHLYWEIADEQ